MEAAHVYKAINEVTAVMASEGLAKVGRNNAQNYNFRGIDDVYNALARHLANAKLCILPRVLSRSVTERTSTKGGAVSYVVLDVEFDFVSAVDGSKHTIRTMGESMDSADKATSKAMSAAMKYACLLAFQIPTEGDNDADAHHIEKAPSLHEPSETESKIASLFESAKTTDDIAAAEAMAARAIKDKQVVNGGRERLLRMRSEAVARVSR